MLGWIAAGVFLIFVVISMIYFLKSRRMKIYRYLSTLALLNVIEGALLFVAAFLSAYDISLYYDMWYIMLIIYIVILVDLLVFAYSNINEGLKKAISISPAAVPLIVLGTAEITLTPGKIMTLITVGFILALMVDLIYITAKVYRIMKGGKLYELWRRMLILTLGYLIFGLVYNIFGVLVMMRVMLPTQGLLAISFGYTVKTIFGTQVVDYYFKTIEPILKATE